MSTDPYDYFFFSQGKVKVDSIDDAEELEFTDVAFDTLGFSQEEKENAFKLTASIAHLGEMTFKQKGREESCEMDDPIPGQKIAQLYGIENWQLFYGNFIRPKIKVGTEWVYKGQNAGAINNNVHLFPHLSSPCRPMPQRHRCHGSVHLQQDVRLACKLDKSCNLVILLSWFLIWTNLGENMPHSIFLQVDLCNRTLIVS